MFCSGWFPNVFTDNHDTSPTTSIRYALLLYQIMNFGRVDGQENLLGKLSLLQQP